jgi:hypothetical protein
VTGERNPPEGRVEKVTMVHSGRSVLSRVASIDDEKALPFMEFPDPRFRGDDGIMGAVGHEVTCSTGPERWAAGLVIQSPLGQ